VQVDATDAEGVLYAHGGVAGGHSLYVKDKKLRYTFYWLGTHFQDVVADRVLTPGQHALTVDFASKGASTDPATPGFTGTASLYVDGDRSAGVRSRPNLARSASSATASASAGTARHR
jgi:arylsulfatase